MGAEQFHSHSDETDVAKAFHEVREQAQWEHGHGGYTGTVAEKHGYVVFDLSLEQVEDLLRRWADTVWDSSRFTGVERKVLDVYDDKWGPAVAVRNPTGGWDFLGEASS